MSKKSVFLGGALTDSQYLFTFPIVDGYCKKKKINKIILEKELSPKVKNNKIIKDIIKNYEIEYLFYNNYKILRTTNILIFQLFKVCYFFLKILFFRPNKDYLKNQYLHAIWDTALRQMNDNELQPSLINILISIIKVLNAGNYSKTIISKNCHAAFMGHNVYTHKVIVAELIKSKVNVYCQVLYSYYKKNISENFWGTVELKELKRIKKKNVIEKYFKNKLLGKGNYEDSNLASLKKYRKKNSYFPRNVIFLHIFRDSPFGRIDNSRIFKDYFEWIKFTIKIINKSNEKWFFKIHPSTKRWGENSKKILENLIDKYSTKKKNIVIDKQYFSNFEIFKNSKRILTYNGTSHLEAISFGTKPIIISHCTMTNFNNDSYFKPKNLEDYENLLLNNHNFKITKKSQIKFAKQLIYLIENYKSFGKDLDVSQTYAGDSKKQFKKEYLSISKNVEKNIKYFQFLGKRLNFGDNYTYSKRFYLLNNIKIL